MFFLQMRGQVKTHVLRNCITIYTLVIVIRTFMSPFDDSLKITSENPASLLGATFIIIFIACYKSEGQSYTNSVILVNLSDTWIQSERLFDDYPQTNNYRESIHTGICY